jgi:pilus assembly protein CpaB
MKKKNLLTLLGIALVVAIISTGVFYGLFVSNLKSNANGKTLVVAAKSLPAGTVLQKTDLSTIPWPAEKLPNGAFETVEQVAGKTTFDGLGESDPVLASQLVSAEGSGRSAGVPSGMRAVSVHVTDSSGVVALLRAGHKVDVQVVLNRTKEPINSQLRTAIEDLEVLAVTPKPQQSSQGYNLPVVTLLASPADADILGLADTGARVRLVLRNPLDTATRTRPSVTLNNVVRAGAQ